MRALEATTALEFSAQSAITLGVARGCRETDHEADCFVAARDELRTLYTVRSPKK